MRQPGSALSTDRDRNESTSALRGGFAAGAAFALALIVASYPLLALGVALGAAGTVGGRRIGRRIERERFRSETRAPTSGARRWRADSPR